jgi:hypothetical protein
VSVLSLAILGVPRLALAQTDGGARRAFTTERVTASGGVRYGTEDLNLGLGARVGYTLWMNLYLGGEFEYWFGESEEVTVPGGGTTSAEAHAWDLMFEAGYDFGVTESLVLRPLGGFGIMYAFGEACTELPGVSDITCIEVSASDAVGSVGGQALVNIGDLNIGGELRLIFAEESAAIIGFNLGGHF